MSVMSVEEVKKLKSIQEQVSKSVAYLPIVQYNKKDVKPYSLNSKKHSKKHIQVLADNIEREGLQESLLIEENGTIVTGHGRFEALKQLGWVNIPVRVMKGYTAIECKLHRIASNRTVSTDYDSDLQAKELQDIQDEMLALGRVVDFADLAGSTGLSERDIEILNTNITNMIDFTDISLDDIELDDKPERKEKTTKKTSDSILISDLLGFTSIPKKDASTYRQFFAMSEIQDEASFLKYCQNFIRVNKS